MCIIIYGELCDKHCAKCLHNFFQAVINRNAMQLISLHKTGNLNSCCGSAEMNATGFHEDMGSIPGLAQ